VPVRWQYFLGPSQTGLSIIAGVPKTCALAVWINLQRATKSMRRRQIAAACTFFGTPVVPTPIAVLLVVVRKFHPNLASNLILGMYKLKNKLL
jgi:hypothetical protein